MARIFNESFEHGTMVRWNGGVGSPSSSSPINGTYRFQMTGTNGMTKVLPSALSEFYLGTYIRPEGLGGIQQIITWRSAATALGCLVFDVAGRLAFYTVNAGGVGVTLAATGTSVLTVGSLYHIQIHVKIDNATGAFELKLNDLAPEISYTNQDTQSGAISTVDTLTFGPFTIASSGFAAGPNASVDDIIINDTTGGADNTWPGVVKFYPLTATGNGFYFGNWTKNSGSAADYTYVDEVPHDSDTTYLYTTSTNIYASFSMSDQALTNVNYRALITSAIARKDSGTAKLVVGIRDNDDSVNYVGTSGNLGVTYGIVEERKTVDPSTGITWTSSGINSTESLIISTA